MEGVLSSSVPAHWGPQSNLWLRDYLEVRCPYNKSPAAWGLYLGVCGSWHSWVCLTLLIVNPHWPIFIVGSVAKPHEDPFGWVVSSASFFRSASRGRGT